MDLQFVDNRFVEAAILVLILIPSIMVHEVSHGFVADRLGDPTARNAGRLTLNPIRHIDPFGSILLPAMLALAGGPVFGWAKPVPVNPGRFVEVRGNCLKPGQKDDDVVSHAVPDPHENQCWHR